MKHKIKRRSRIVIALFLLLLAAPLHAETQAYMVEMYDYSGQLVVISQLNLEFDGQKNSGSAKITGAFITEFTDPALEGDIGPDVRVIGSMHKHRLGLKFIRHSFLNPLEIHAVFRPEQNGAFQGR